MCPLRGQAWGWWMENWGLCWREDHTGDTIDNGILNAWNNCIMNNFVNQWLYHVSNIKIIDSRQVSNNNVFFEYHLFPLLSTKIRFFFLSSYAILALNYVHEKLIISNIVNWAKAIDDTSGRALNLLRAKPGLISCISHGPLSTNKNTWMQSQK